MSMYVLEAHERCGNLQLMLIRTGIQSVVSNHSASIYDVPYLFGGFIVIGKQTGRVFFKRARKTHTLCSDRHKAIQRINPR